MLVSRTETTYPAGAPVLVSGTETTYPAGAPVFNQVFKLGFYVYV